MSPLLLIMEEAFAPYFSPQRTQSPQSSMMAKGEAQTFLQGGIDPSVAGYTPAGTGPDSPPLRSLCIPWWWLLH